MLFSNTLSYLLRPLVVLLVSAPVILLVLALETSPAVPPQQALATVEIGQIEQFLLDSAPESPTDRSLQQVRLDAEELNLLLRYALEVMNLAPNWVARAVLEQDALMTQISINLLDGGIPLYLNLTGDFSSQQQTLVLKQLRVGKLQVPDRFLRYSLNRLRSRLLDPVIGNPDLDQLLSNVEQVNIDVAGMDVSIQWDPVLFDSISTRAQQLFISEADQQRIMAYYGEIYEIASTIPADLRAVSLNTFLVPLFSEARQKVLTGSDPVAENRTLLQALAIYVNDGEIAQLIGPELAQQLPAAKFIEVRLQRRQDLAQHLVSIAAISASAGAGFAQLLSTTKEAYDARYRSGFSFSDLTANSVGVTLASLATRDYETALLMQERLANLQNESDYMPEVGSNRDGLSESDFTEQYQDRNSAEYQQRLQQIQALIDARPLFQNL